MASFVLGKRPAGDPDITEEASKIDLAASGCHGRNDQE